MFLYVFEGFLHVLTAKVSYNIASSTMTSMSFHSAHAASGALRLYAAGLPGRLHRGAAGAHAAARAGAPAEPAGLRGPHRRLHPPPVPLHGRGPAAEGGAALPAEAHHGVLHPALGGDEAEGGAEGAGHGALDRPRACKSDRPRGISMVE